ASAFGPSRRPAESRMSAPARAGAKKNHRRQGGRLNQLRGHLVDVDLNLGRGGSQVSELIVGAAEDRPDSRRGQAPVPSQTPVGERTVRVGQTVGVSIRNDITNVWAKGCERDGAVQIGHAALAGCG